jgi:hypothetical protein
MIARLTDRLGWTGFHACEAKNTFAQVKRDRIGRCPGDCLRWTNWYTSHTTFGAFRRINTQSAAVTIRQRGRRPRRERHCLTTAPQPVSNGIKDKHNQRSKPQ